MTGLDDALKLAMQSEIAKIRTSIPGQIVSYDPATQTATVQPVIRGRFRNEESGEIESYLPPKIAGVPVLFPGAGGYSITWPLAAGDEVDLLFTDRSIAEWKAKGGGDVEPRDLRRFDLSDAIAIPGLRSSGNAIPAAGVASGAVVIRGAEVRLGDATASQFVALANLVDARCTAIENYLTTHIHVDPMTGSTGPPTVPPSAGSSTAATKVKAL